MKIILLLLRKVVLTKLNIFRRSRGRHIGVTSSKRLEVSESDACTGLLFIERFDEISQLLQNYQGDDGQ
jgi:hypothetical protein